MSWETIWNSSFSLSEIFGYGLLLVIIGMTYYHFYMNWKWKVRRKHYRSLLLFVNYHIKFVLLWSMVYHFSSPILYAVGMIATIAYMIGSSVVLGSMGLHYNWEFASGRVNGISRAQDGWYHLKHDLLALIGVTSLLWFGWFIG